MDKFDQLRQWNSLDSDTLRNEFDVSAKNVINDLLSELASKEVQRKSITSDNFPSVVRELHELFVTGSRDFGSTWILSEEEVEAFVDLLKQQAQITPLTRHEPLDFPVISVGQWPNDLSLRREDMYGDDGR